MKYDDLVQVVKIETFEEHYKNLSDKEVSISSDEYNDYRNRRWIPKCLYKIGKITVAEWNDKKNRLEYLIEGLEFNFSEDELELIDINIVDIQI